MEKILQKLLIYAALLFLFQFLIQPVLAEEAIVLEFFYSSGCGTCTDKLNITQEIEEKYREYNDTIVFQIKDIADNVTYYREYRSYQKNYSVSFPFVTIRNETNLTIIPSYYITEDYLNETIAAYLAGAKPNETIDEDIIEFDFLFWHIKINISGLSLPVLTVVLGGLDSFNPCAFFILIFLLNLLLYVRSRQRMLLIGGVFIFFSGLFYFLFMFVLFEVFLLTRTHVLIVTIVAGVIALILGVINIKDFFFFKKGASLSIPEDKKPKVYKKMRDLVKTPQLSAVIIGAVILAVIVNFYELLCTLGLPLVFTRELTTYNLSTIQYSLYIFFYNVVYVIPLIVIVLIFVFTLGRRKLTEWHGQVLKLLTGIMLASFGVLFLVDYKILENVVTPVLLLVFSLVATFVISFIWKKYIDKKESG